MPQYIDTSSLIDASRLMQVKNLYFASTSGEHGIYFAGTPGDNGNLSEPYSGILNRNYDPSGGSNVQVDYSELLLFQFNDPGPDVGPDRIRHLAAVHTFQVYPGVAVSPVDTAAFWADQNYLTAMTIANSGNVGIGTSNPQYSLDIYDGNIGTSGTTSNMNYYANQHSFYVNGVDKVAINNNVLFPAVDNTVSLGVPNGQRWTALYAVNGTIQTSDSNLKDWEPLPYGLAEVNQIEPIKFQWKSQKDLPDDDPEKDAYYYGVCANQFVGSNALLPELVYQSGSNAPLQVNYSELIPVLINAVKELSSKSEALSAENTAQASKLESLSADNAAQASKLESLSADNAVLLTKYDALSAKYDVLTTTQP
jgi:hypothetical protein